MATRNTFQIGTVADNERFLRSLLLYEPNSQLYLLAADGTVLASTGRMQLAPGFISFGLLLGFPLKFFGYIVK